MLVKAINVGSSQKERAALARHGVALSPLGVCFEIRRNSEISLDFETNHDKLTCHGVAPPLSGAAGLRTCARDKHALAHTRAPAGWGGGVAGVHCRGHMGRGGRERGGGKRALERRLSFGNGFRIGPARVAEARTSGFWAADRAQLGQSG